MNRGGNYQNEFILLLGEAILLASMQFSIGSVEMSSKFSVKNFSKDQETLQNAADALTDYLRIAYIWTIGVAILLFARYDKIGSIVSIMINIIIIAWIYFSYTYAFKTSSIKNNLAYPVVSLI